MVHSPSRSVSMMGSSKRRESDDQGIPLQETTSHHGGPIKTHGLSHRPSIYERYFDDAWGLELVSWVAATVMTLVLLVLLGEFNQRSLSQWHSGLSLNTIIAVLSQLVQMVLIVPIASSLSQLKWLWYRKGRTLKDFEYYDDASAGLWSSLVLLYKRHTSLIVWFGVIGMILQALFGAFAQQALSLPLREVATPTNSTIRRSLSYDTPLGSEQLGNTVTFPEVVTEMKLAIYTGLLRDGVSPSEVAGESTTGNCTFGTYASLGVCASVVDVTSSIDVDCKDTDHFSGISDSNCSYSVPALRSHLPFSNVRTSPGEDYHSTLYVGASMIYVDAETSDTSQTPINDTLIEFYIIYVPDLTTLPVPPASPNSQPAKTNYKGKLVALKATLSLCAQIYNSSMQFGVTKTTLQSQQMHLPWRHGAAANDNNQEGYLTTVQGKPDTLFMNPASFNGLSVWLVTSIFNGTGAMPPPAPPPTKDPKTGAPIINVNPPAVFETLTSKQIATHLYGSETGTKAPDGVRAMTALLDNVAMSMSNAFRTTSTVPSMQSGTTYATDIYFDVDWRWLIVPILSIPVTFIALALTVLKTSRQKVPAWKSSKLAILQALSPSVRSRMGEGMAKNSEMASILKAESVHVQLRGERGSWELGE